MSGQELYDIQTVGLAFTLISPIGPVNKYLH
jgi:hypothetical protein